MAITHSQKLRSPCGRAARRIAFGGDVFKIDASQLKSLRREFAGLAGKQIPFVTAYALTLTAKDAQAEIRADLPKHFTIRNRRAAQGIRIEMTRKGREPSVTVFTKDDWLAFHELGGRRSVRDGKHRAVPAGIRSSQSKIVRAGRPAALLGKPGHFINRSEKSGILGLFRRLPDVAPKNRFSKAAGTKVMSRRVKLLYILMDPPSLRARLGMVQTVQKICDARLQANFVKAWAFARDKAR